MSTRNISHRATLFFRGAHAPRVSGLAPRQPHSSRRPERASALVIVLACIVILSILLVSYLTAMQLDRLSTQNYSSSAKAEELARGSLQEILGDLRKEIDAGSLAGAVYLDANGSNRIYIPVTNAAALPARIGFAAIDYTNDVSPTKLPPTLVRMSRATDPFYTSPPGYYDATKLPPNRASAASSTNASANRRTFSPARWNKPLLLGTNVPAAFSAAPPDWIYVTRAGSRTCTTSEIAALKPTSDLTQTNQVIGRYAYVIYDEGALLDVNVAGSPSSATNSASFKGKSYLTYADLTQIPGLSQTLVDNLVAWRNKGGMAAASGSYTNAVAQYSTNGFLRAAAGDSPLLSRQDLIDYMTKVAGQTNSLAYLGTFSRAVDAPTWKPTATTGSPSGNITDYAGQSENASSANRDLANVRFAYAGTITHYKDDGTHDSKSDYTVNAGDPLLQRRFSLAKLAWLAHSGPAAGISDTAIQTAFGLKWNPSKARWDYVGSTGSTAQSAIKTLAQVAAEPTSREPNFFELLKAGILSGSLGKHPGVATPGPFIASAVWGEGSRKVEGPLGADFESYSNVSDFQLIQIGANIIDQSDTDNYPTAIYLNFTPPRSYPEGELFQTAFGTENLPYLARMGLLNAITKDAGAVGGNQTNSSWIQPELWNPHQDPGGYPSASTPTQLRLVTFGECFTGNADVVLPNAANPKNPGDPVVFGDDPSTPSDQGRIDFTNSSVFFNNPVPLTSIATGGSASSPTTKNQWPTTASGCLIDFSSINPFVAVWTGDVERIKPAAPTSNRIRIVPDLNLTFLLQYNDGAGWRPYSLMARIQTMGTQSWASANSNGNPGWKEFAGRPDPRTDRFSAAQGETQGGNSPMLWPFKSTIRWDSAATAYGAVGAGYPLPGAGFTYSPLPVSPPNYAQSLYINLWAQNQSSATNPNGSKAYYPDPDDVIRPGDAFRANYTTGDGIMLYHLISPAGVSSSAATGRRPVILNHPFRSVGELGYAFRDLPFKTLDFWSDMSADAGLLDLFSVNDGPGIVAGQINPNNAPVPVLQAAIAGTMKNEASGLAFGSADAQTMAAQIASQISSVPLLSRADLVPAISSAIAVKLGAIPDLANKAYGEVSVRALAPATSTRTWNLLIDVVAQAGRMSPNAAGLNDFIVEGERRYWLHVAIDRYTGKIVDQQLEPVYE